MQTDNETSGSYVWDDAAYGNRNQVQFVNFLGAVGKPLLLAVNNGRWGGGSEPAWALASERRLQALTAWALAR